MSAGKELRLDPEQEQQLRDNLGLVRYVLRKRFNLRRSDADYDDAYQHGCVALIRAIKCYDASIATPSTYFARAIAREIGSRMYKPRYRQKRGGGVIPASLDAEFNLDGLDSPVTYADMLAAPGDVADEVVTAVAYSGLVEYMRVHAPLTCMHILDGKKWREIAEELGMPYAAVASATGAYELQKLRKDIKKRAPTVIGNALKESNHNQYITEGGKLQMDEISKDWIIKVAEIITDLHRDAQLTQMLLVQEQEKRKAIEAHVNELEQRLPMEVRS